MGGKKGGINKTRDKERRERENNMGERRILEKDESWTKLNKDRKMGGERKGERRGRETQKK